MNQPLNTPESEGERIEPAEFRAVSRYRAIGTKTILKWAAAIVVAISLCLMGGSAWFIFTAQQVDIQIEPEPESISIEGGIMAPRLGAHFLMRPGNYSLTADKTCYRKLSHQFQVGTAEKQQIRLVMEKLPGKLMVNVHREDQPDQILENVRITIDGQEMNFTPMAAFDVVEGARHLEISAQNYKPLKREISVDGCGKLQELTLALIPGWSNLAISSQPSGATVEINGEVVGKTPTQLEVAEGRHELALKAAGYKTWQRQLDIVANQPFDLEEIKLQPADGRLTVTTVPSGASISVGERAVGRTPLDIDLSPDKNYTIRISKQGFESEKRTVRLKTAVSKAISIKLKPRTGRVDFDISPPDAELWIDGVEHKSSSRQLDLHTVEHQLEVKKEGYVPYRKRILPRPGNPLKLQIALTPAKPVVSAVEGRIKAPNGYDLLLVSPAAFTMGSSRREQGRRSNETKHSVTLTRPYYLGMLEVTNKEFRQFQDNHRSGRYQAQELDSDQLPVVQVSWEQAALFCNWLSAKESLPPVYVIIDGRLTAADPIGIGYRLPTEAEWAYAARIGEGSANTGKKFPWGNGFPPPGGSGNFADVSAQKILSSYLETYNDGYPVAAPPGKFKANRIGLHDLGGNVAEWCHDYYDISAAGKKQADPTGPKTGRHHVVRGSSWKNGSISALRLAYRDYSDSKRPDLGFRVARYAK